MSISQLVPQTHFPIDQYEKNYYAAMLREEQLSQEDLAGIDLEALFQTLSPICRLMLFKTIFEGKEFTASAKEIKAEYGVDIKPTLIRDYFMRFTRAIRLLIKQNLPAEIANLTKSSYELYTAIIDSELVMNFWQEVSTISDDYSQIATKLIHYYSEAISLNGFRRIDLALTEEEYKLIYALLVESIDFADVRRDHVATIKSLYRYALKAVKAGTVPDLASVVIAAYAKFQRYAPQLLLDDPTAAVDLAAEEP